MTAVVLHFGMNKTGSSSIQFFLSKLPRSGPVRFADLGIANQSIILVAAFSAAPELYGQFRRRGLNAEQARAKSSEYRSMIEREVLVEGVEKILFSGEGVLNLSVPELTDLHRTLSTRQNEVSAVGYVRQPGGFIESSFQQKLKTHSASFELDVLYPKYRHRLGKFDRVFGRANVHCWLFEPATFPQRNVVHDFCQRIGIDVPRQDIPRVNDTLSRPACALLYAYRKYGPPYGTGEHAVHENNLLVNQLRLLKGERMRLSRALIDPVLARHEDDIAWMERRLGQPFSSSVGEDGATPVHGEDDLLEFEAPALLWLARQLGPEFEDKCQPQMGPELVADWMHQLRQRLAKSQAVQRPR